MCILKLLGEGRNDANEVKHFMQLILQIEF